MNTVADKPPVRRFRRWYADVTAAVNDGWPRRIRDIKLTIDNYNNLGDIAKVLFDADPNRDAEEVRMLSINSFILQNEIKNGKWVPRQICYINRGIRFINPYAPQPNVESVRRETI